MLKLVHVYGSTGKGGRLRTSLREVLDALHAAGRIGSIVTGESFSIFDAASRGLLDRYPDLRRDSDLERGNPGVTLVELAGRRYELSTTPLADRGGTLRRGLDAVVEGSNLRVLTVEQPGDRTFVVTLSLPVNVPQKGR